MAAKIKHLITATLLFPGASTAHSGLITMDLIWNGSGLSATGTLTADDSLINSGGAVVSLLSDVNTVFSITTPNGTFNTSDFNTLNWQVPGVDPLDLSLNSQLIGQPLSTGPTFGTPNSGGQFVMFGDISSAAFNLVNGCDNSFGICFNRTGASPLALTSAIITAAADELSAVPVPGASWLFGVGLMAFGGVARRNRQ